MKNYHLLSFINVIFLIAAVISDAVTVNQYNSPAKGLISFPKDVHVEVISKEAGTNLDLWGIQVRFYTN